jgi:hypothetical protein
VGPPTVRLCNSTTILKFQTAVPLVSCPKQRVNSDDVQAAYHGIRHRRIQKYTVKSFITRIPSNIYNWVDENSVTKMWGSFNTTEGLRRIRNIGRKIWNVGSITANTKEVWTRLWTGSWHSADRARKFSNRRATIISRRAVIGGSGDVNNNKQTNNNYNFKFTPILPSQAPVPSWQVTLVITLQLLN